jgi:uncharacterized protein (TIGR03437 family)
MRTLALPVALLATLGVISGFAQSQISVVNYAGFSGTFPIAPGSIGSIYGSFANVPLTSASTLNPMPTQLAGLQVRIGSRVVPLYFVSSGQINFVVPYGVEAGNHAVEVVSGGNVIGRGAVNVVAFAPGIATLDTADPNRPGIVQNFDPPNTVTTNSSTNRARPGQTIVIYTTGCGEVNPPVPTGQPATSQSNAVANVKVYISVLEAQVSFAGASPQFPGICQVNAIVPNAPYVTGQVPLRITVNGVPSNDVSIWVQ